MKKKKLTIPEQRKVVREEAMPEVKKLVRKYGRQAVASCINSLREYEKKLRQLELAKQEVARLEREV